ncbi:hypothetical protein HMPREF1129_2837 [Actinomyces naeslundii str. Howell 279]|uniref:Uncharacterized protein n=1 Tax=Actinomyces naeslundii (strain ATCC 12104 / DSM 43013 / CCUG 2238 / JCM 8349 / NCTC 10301 / Howell 279) TaxID=1115803 RepID=J3F4Y9_ACTNH|nr:hypothetical protein HMPREF1129_2837 [Actinomyces naeslundii str. Howell 279]
MVGTGLPVGGAARLRHHRRLYPGDQVLLPRPHPLLPPFNGPDALSEEELEEREDKGLPVAEYTIGADHIYISVGWSDANALVKIVGQMAWTQRLAVAYVSDDSSIVRP